MMLSVALLPLSTFYGAATRLRLAAYRRGWLSVSKLDVPVISVGNLTTGGTGKTPLVEWVCRAIASEDPQRGWLTGKKVCVLTRGYGRENPKTQVVVSNGNEVLASEREAGDEPLLLAKSLLGTAAVVANPNRAAAGEWAVNHLNVECFVLDDGFQHLRLARDLDIVTIDATNPWGGGSLLPTGLLREPRSSLLRADCLVITRTDQTQHLALLKKTLQQLVGTVPVFSSRMVTSKIRQLEGQSVKTESLRSQKLIAFCGVGNPESFFSHLRREGLAPALTHPFAVHHNYDQSDLDELLKEANFHRAEGLITTAKDAIKLESLNFTLPCYVLEIKILIDDENRLIEMIRTTVSTGQ